MKIAVQLIDEAIEDEIKGLIKRLSNRLVTTQEDIAEREFITDLGAIHKAGKIAIRNLTVYARAINEQ